MAVFCVLLLVPMMLQHFTVGGYNIDYKKKNKAALALFFILLTVLVMLRHESVGSDTRNYMRFFGDFSTMDWPRVGYRSAEPGFSWFNKVVSLFSKQPQFFLAAAGLTVSALIYPTYRRLCVDTSLTLVLFCTMSTFVMMFSGIRQMLAIGIGFIAYEFTRQKKLFPFVLMVALAMTFHTSAFMLVFLYPIYHARITRKWLYAVVPVLATVFVFNKPIFSVLALILEQYTKYDGSIEETGAYTMLVLFVAFAVFAYIIPDESNMDDETVGLRNILLLALAIQIFAPLHTLAMRMNYYFIIFIPLILPKIIACRSERWDQVAVWGRHIMVVFFLAYFFITAYGGGGLNVFPYHFFWEKVL